MFQFITQWRVNGLIKKLEAGLQRRPTPQLYLQLADAHKDAGNHQRAAQVLKLGVARFPSAPELNRRQAEAEKIERENEKKRLQEKISSHPNPILYARLAELCMADKEEEKTIQICQSGIKSFPRYGGTYLVLGQIYVERKNWDTAREMLEKSVELDKYNYMALKLLAQVYIELNRPSDADKRLADILYFAPGDEAILELQRKAREKLGGRGGERREVLDTGPVSGRATERKTIVAGKLTNQRERSQQSLKDQLLNEGIASLRAVEGVLGAILVDQYGLVVAADLDSSMDEGLVGALITNVYRTAGNDSVRLGIGQFEDGLIEGRQGNIHIILLGEMILAVFAKETVKMGFLEKHIRDFAATVAQQR
jgi:predicted regulator of Ras-like GTPase activity (Roadblock/LC7/MglB family)